MAKAPDITTGPEPDPASPLAPPRKGKGWSLSAIPGAIVDGVVAFGDTIGDFFQKPYKDAEEANRRAGSRLEQIGADAQSQEQAGIGRALEQTAPAARYWNKTYEGEGALAGPGAAETRYTDVRSGLDPSFTMALDEGNRQINNSFAAKGLNNSGASERARALMAAKVISDREGRLDLLAQGAQGAAETRMGGAFDRLSNLGAGRAGIVQQGTEAGVNSMVAGRTGRVNANLNADQQAGNFQKDLLSTISHVGGAAVGAMSGNPGAAAPMMRQRPRGYGSALGDDVMTPTRF